MTWKIKNKNNYKARISYKVWNPVTGTEPPIFSSADVAKNSYITLSDYNNENVLSYKYYASGLNPVTNTIITTSDTISGFKVNPNYNIYGTFDLKYKNERNSNGEYFAFKANLNLYTNGYGGSKIYWTVLYPNNGTYDGQTNIVESQNITIGSDNTVTCYEASCNISSNLFKSTGAGIRFYDSNYKVINWNLVPCTSSVLPKIGYTLTPSTIYLGDSITIKPYAYCQIDVDDIYLRYISYGKYYALSAGAALVTLSSNDYSTNSFRITINPSNLQSTLWLMDRYGNYIKQWTCSYSYSTTPNSDDAKEDVIHYNHEEPSEHIYDTSKRDQPIYKGNGIYTADVYYGWYRYGIYVYTSDYGENDKSNYEYIHSLVYCTNTTPTLDTIYSYLKSNYTELKWDNYNSYNTSFSTLTTTNSLSTVGSASMYFYSKYYIKGINSCRVSPTYTITQDFTIVSQGTPTVVSADKSIATATIYNLGSYYKLSVTGVSTGDVALTISATGCKDKTVNVHCKDINDPTITWSSEVESMYGVDTLYIYATISNPNDFSVKLYLENSSSAATTMSANSSYKVTIWQNDPREDHSNVTCSARLEDSGRSSHLVSSTYNNE